MRHSVGPVCAVLFDLDGVVRHWDPEIIVQAEVTAGLPAGVLSDAVLRNTELLLRVTTGQLTDARWRDMLATELSQAYGPAGAQAVRAWSSAVGEVVGPVLDLVRTTRQRMTVALLSNATTRLEEDLASLGLDREFDVVFNSSRLGVAKPNPEVFAKVCAQLEARPGQCAFVDDSPANVGAAEAVGLIAHLYEDPQHLDDFLREL